VFYFVKKREGTDVLETKIKVSKTQKETGRDYKFSKTHQTAKVKFYDYNETKDAKYLFVEVPIEKIASNSYSLNYAEYMKDETEEEQYEDGVVVKTLGEVCNFKNGKGIKKDTLIEGEYPVIGGGQKPMGFHNEYNADENTILCSSSGAYAGFISKYDKKVWASDCFSIIPKNSINNTYLYYLLKTIQDKIYKLQTGTAQPHIYSKDLQNIKIPIPSLERQQEIVKYLDFIYEKANKTSNEKIAELKHLNEFCLSNQKIFGENVVKELGEICEVNQGNSLTKTKMIDGIYDVIGGGKIIGKHNEKNRDGDDFTLTRVGDININYIDKPYYLTDNGFSLKSTQEDIMTKYLYYLLSHNKNNLTNLYQGTAQKVISKTNLKSIKIPIPSIERQKEIVAYCEYNDTLIKQLEKEIENNKKQAHQFITGIVKAQVQTEEQSDTSSVNTEPIDEVQNEIVSVEEDTVELLHPQQPPVINLEPERNQYGYGPMDNDNISPSETKASRAKKTKK